MATARNIIEDAARKINILGRGETLPADEALNALGILNGILGSWSVEGGLVYTESTETFSLTGATSYTIGSGGDFNTTRPSYITSLYTTQGGIDYEATQIDQARYAEITQKSNVNSDPEMFYYDGNYPLAKIYFFPVPDATYTVTINSIKPLTEFASLSTSYDLPPEYRRALVANLAVEWAVEHEKEASPTLKKIAKNAKDLIFISNTRNDQFLSTYDSAVLPAGGFNIYSGQYNT